MPVDRKAGAGQRRRAERAFVHAGKAVAHARKVAAEHFDIGHAVMAERDRLRGLQVGKARHDRTGMLLGARQEGLDQPLQRGDCLFCLGAHPHAEIKRHLVVARARRVQPPGRRTDQVGEPRLDIHVDVFQLAREDEVALFDL